jgi:hypothetical protein
MKAPSLKVTISGPSEFPDRKLPYVVRWRLNGRGHWRSFATKRGRNGADAFYALLNVAALNERDWDPESGIPASMSARLSRHFRRCARFDLAIGLVAASNSVLRDSQESRAQLPRTLKRR